MAGISTPTVRQCPYTQGSNGVMEFTPEVIAQIAGAVRDRDEWLLLLAGTRSEDGFHVSVNNLIAPPQKRGGAHVTIGAHAGLADLEMPINGPVLKYEGADIVGVMHSHNTMRAFFSVDDENTLNPNFPSSIVVAYANNALGFEYQAVGKTRLSCGSRGEISFLLKVAGSPRFAPTTLVAHPKFKDLGDCNKYKTQKARDEYHAIEKSECGLSARVERTLIFGLDKADIMKRIQEATVASPPPQSRPNNAAPLLLPGRGSHLKLRSGQFCDTCGHENLYIEVIGGFDLCVSYGGEPSCGCNCAENIIPDKTDFNSEDGLQKWLERRNAGNHRVTDEDEDSYPPLFVG